MLKKPKQIDITDIENEFQKLFLTIKNKAIMKTKNFLYFIFLPFLMIKALQTPIHHFTFDNTYLINYDTTYQLNSTFSNFIFGNRNMDKPLIFPMLEV